MNQLRQSKLMDTMKLYRPSQHVIRQCCRYQHLWHQVGDTCVHNKQRGLTPAPRRPTCCSHPASQFISIVYWWGAVSDSLVRFLSTFYSRPTLRFISNPAVDVRHARVVYCVQHYHQTVAYLRGACAFPLWYEFYRRFTNTGNLFNCLVNFCEYLKLLL